MSFFLFQKKNPPGKTTMIFFSSKTSDIRYIPEKKITIKENHEKANGSTSEFANSFVSALRKL
jgi:hypothetical protein